MVLRRRLPPKTVVDRTAAHDWTPAPRMVRRRIVARRTVEHRILSLPLRRLNRVYLPALLNPVLLSPVPLVQILLPPGAPSSPSAIDNERVLSFTMSCAPSLPCCHWLR